MTDDRKFSEDELRTMLTRAAGAHQPDRTMMLNRIAANRAAERGIGRRPRQAVRMAGAAFAVTAVLSAGGVAQWALAGDDRDDAPAAPPSATASRQFTPSPATPSPRTPAAVTPSRPPTSQPTSKRPATPTTPPRTTPPAGEPEGGIRVQQGPLWSDGSVRRNGDDAARSEITLKLDEPVTALTVTVRVQRTGGLADQGAVHDVSGARIDTQVIQEPDAFVYLFTLGSGTLAEGTHVFTARYAHEDGGRDAGKDTYRATATTVDGEKLTVYGDFF